MKKTCRKLTALLLAALMMLSLLTACGSRNNNDNNQSDIAQADQNTLDSTSDSAPDSTPDSTPDLTPDSTADDDVDGELIVDHEEEVQYAKFFRMTHYKGGYISFQISGGEEDDWIYLIVPEGKSVPADLGSEYVILQQPIDRIRCDAGTATVIAAFGGLDHISSTDTELKNTYVKSVADEMEAGNIAYSGGYKEPDYEMVTSLETQLVLTSNSLDLVPEVKEKYLELGIPFVVNRCSKEVHPLGYVEWAKVFGAIVGMWDEANAYFDDQIEQVNAVSSAEKNGKTVAMAYFSTDGTKVYARRGGDHYAAMVDLAGGEYIMADYDPDETGVATIGLEDFFQLCSEADILINLNMAAKLYTMDELLDFVPIVKEFKAVKEGNVYVARERIGQFCFDNAAIIADLNTLMTDSTVDTTYFTKMK